VLGEQITSAASATASRSDLRLDPRERTNRHSCLAQRVGDRAALLPIAALLVLVAVVFVQEGQRKIPIQYARRMVGRRATGGASTYMPLRVNMAGVISGDLRGGNCSRSRRRSQVSFVDDAVINRYVQPGTFTYLGGEALLIVAFTFV